MIIGKNEFDMDIENERMETTTKYQYSLCDEKNGDFLVNKACFTSR